MNGLHKPLLKAKHPSKPKKPLSRFRLLPGFFPIVVSLVVSACANEKPNKLLSKMFSPEACIGQIDWYSVGMSDGQLGVEPGYFGIYEKSCARKSRVPDRDAYFEAYKIGLRSYCDPENIYKLARRGAVSIGACEETPAIKNAVQKGFANLLEQSN